MEQRTCSKYAYGSMEIIFAFKHEISHDPHSKHLKHDPNKQPVINLMI